MIYGIFQIIQDDAKVLAHWAKGEEIEDINEEEQQQRIQVAASRMLAFVGMAFGSLWALSLLTFVITIPAKIILKLATAIGIYALAHDIFVMSQNANQQEFQQGVKSRLMGLFRGQEELEEDRASQFTHGTFLQPGWMWLYAHRNKIP
jgi:hypothetical protein